MKWIGVTGPWRRPCPELEQDLKREVAGLLGKGNGIVAGGALGVDYAATALALEYAPDGSRIKVLLPTTLEIYSAHYRKRVREGVISTQQAEDLIAQLELINKTGSLIANHEQTEVNGATYYLRNTEVVNASDELLAFQVNQSAGTQDTINKAKAKGIPVKIFTYTVD